MSDSVKPDWLSIQYDSFQRFFSKEDPTPELSLQSIIAEFNKNSSFKINSWDISEPPSAPDECIITNKTFSSELCLSIDYPEEAQLWRNKITIPSPTIDGKFIIDSNGLMANCYIMIMEINRSPGIHYEIEETDTAIERTLIIKPLIGKEYKHVIKRDKSSGLDYPHVILGSSPCYKNFSVIGKKQIAHSLKSKATINIMDPILTIDEFDAIIMLFKNNQLDETDERSWVNLKVNLVGDHLYRIFYNNLINAKFIIGEEYDQYINVVLSFEKLEKTLEYFFRNSSLFQFFDNNNPLYEISQKRSLTLSKHPGFPSKGLLLKKRDVHPTDFGRVCSIESPQGKELGFNLYLAKDARISSLGTIETPFKDINTGEEIFLDPFDEHEKVKAFSTTGEVSYNRVVFTKAPNDEVTLGLANSITHKTITAHSFLGYSASLIPFIQHNDGSRALMGANMMKQAVLLRDPEPPFVRTGFESVIAQRYSKDSKSPFIINNLLCLGKNLLVGYMPWDLLNYEDGIVVSDRLSRKNILTHIEKEDIIFDQMDAETIDIGSIVKQGSKVSPGKRLIRKTRVVTKAEDKFIMLGVKGKSEDCSLYAPKDMTGVVKDVQKITQNLPGESSLRIIITVEKAYPIQLGDKLTGRHGNKGVVSAIMPERDMPYFITGENGCSDDKCMITKPHTHLDVLLNPLGITGRMNVGQLYETALGWIAKHTSESEGRTVEPFSKEWSWDRIKTVMTENNLSPKQKLYFYRDGVEKEIGAGQSSGHITVGYQYMMKLSHHAAKKMTARSQDDHEYDLTMGQPTIHKFSATEVQNIWKNRDSRKRKGQRLGEMEVWALEGHSAWHIIDEFLFLKSDAEQDRSHFVKYMEGLENELNGVIHLQREHRSLKTLAHYCRGLGLELEATDKDANVIEIAGQFSPNIWPELKSLLIRIATDKERDRWAQSKEIKNYNIEPDGLWSNTIFGDENDPNDTKVKDAYGIIHLPIPIDNPLFSSLFRDILEVEEEEIYDSQDLYDFFKNIDWNQIINKIDKKRKLHELIRYIINNGYTHDDFFIKNLLVLPKSLRIETSDVSDAKFPKYRNDINYLYKKIIKAIKDGNWNIKSESNRYDIESLRRYVHALLVNGKISPLSYDLPIVKVGGEFYNSILALTAGYEISKTGIIRKNLLGKRVDFSGRAVIIPDPDLGLNEAGIPYEMAKTLFQPMLVREYFIRHPQYNRQSEDAIKKAIIFINQEVDTAKEWLSKILQDNFIILNREPSLHSLSILSFRPRLYDYGNVIRINPYVCKAYNADFDGDTMSAYVPMLPESKIEAKRMLPSECLRSPASGELLISNKADIGLGAYLHTLNANGWQTIKESLGLNQEVGIANDLQKCFELSYKDKQRPFEEHLRNFTELIRPILNTQGITMGLDDFAALPEIADSIIKAKRAIYKKAADSPIDDLSAYIHDVLSEVEKKLTARGLIPTSNMKILAESNSAKIKLMQLLGMRSYPLKPGGREVPCPILSNIFEGLSPLEYFNSCHGSRYGLADKGLTTAVAGGLTNVLVQAVQDIFVTQKDCETDEGLYFSDFKDTDAGKILLEERIINRYLAEDITIDGEVVAKGTLIATSELASRISKNADWVKIRSPIFCRSKEGICQKCYGLDLSTGHPPHIGDYPAGIVAAQSIGEPGTQLALRSFHTGGVSGSGIGADIETAIRIFSASYVENMPQYSMDAAKKITTPNKMHWHIISDQDINKLPKQYPVLMKPDQSAVKYIFKNYKTAAAAEYILHVLQRVYNSSAKIKDHHFEIVIRKMLSIGKIRGIITVGRQDPGFLARLAFRSLSKVLMEAALAKEKDDLKGLKERIIAGKIIV